jgi:hypothetical protein
MTKTTTMRVDAKVKTALTIIAGEVQAEKAIHNLSTADALWLFIEKHRPDITERVMSIIDEYQEDIENQAS